MNKTIITVFKVIGILVLIFLIWKIFFTDDGVLVTGYKAVRTVVNTQWEKVSGNPELLPDWNTDTNGKGANIDTN